MMGAWKTLRPAEGLGGQRIEPARGSDLARSAQGRRSDPVRVRALERGADVWGGAARKPDALDLALGAALTRGDHFSPDRHRARTKRFIEERQTAAAKSAKKTSRQITRSELAGELIRKYPTARDRERFRASPEFARLSVTSQELLEVVLLEIETAEGAYDDDEPDYEAEGGIRGIQAGIAAEDAAWDAQGDDDAEEDEEDDESDVEYEGWGS